MGKMSLILLAAGSSSRFGSGVKKQWIRIGNLPLWEFVTKRFINGNYFDDIFVVAHPEEVEYFKMHGDYRIIPGGTTRQHSLKNALKHVTAEYVMVSDVARACIAPLLLDQLFESREQADCIVPTLGLHDTTVYNGNTIDRTALLRIQTPQLSKTDSLKKALQTDMEYTDESSAIVANGGTRLFIKGDEQAHKLTTLSDLEALDCLKRPDDTQLVGNGMDVHAFDPDRTMTLGGVPIDCGFGFKAHSDGDVAIHALIDALLGAAGMDDIGTMFPDTDHAYENVDSKILLEKVVVRLHQYGFQINNVDITIAAQTPRLSSYKTAMRRALAPILNLPPVRVGIKATTTEQLGFIGRKEGVGVFATATLRYRDWTTL